MILFLVVKKLHLYLCVEKTIFIINPNSAKGQYQQFINNLSKLVENPNIFISKSKEECYDFIKSNFNRYDIFIAVWGDGTISSISEQLLFSDKILGVYPMGSGNGFARDNNFGSNVQNLVSKIKNGQSKSIDSIKIGDYLSINVSGIGLDSEVAYNFEKTSRGLWNYVKVTFMTFFKFKGIKVKFEDAYKKYDGDYFMVNIANTKQFGNNAFIAPQAKIDDGKADIVLVKQTPVYLAPKFVYQLFTQNLKENRFLSFLKVTECELSIDSDLWHIDGDAQIIASPVKIKIQPESLRILV